MGSSDRFELVGHVLDGRYRVERVVGEGGFGVVYRGFHLTFEHAIAIKCLKTPSHFTEEAQAVFIAKFREEAKLLSRLSQHPAIVRVYDFNTVQTPRGISVPYMVLEWLDGEPLDAWLVARGGRPVPEAEAVALMRPVIEALAFAHSQSIAHRDVKPANIFVVVGPYGRSTKVLDFGIAKAMQEGETATQLKTRTSSGFSAFSPSYGAPEQFRTKKFGPTGPWTDVHALGLILTELVTGKPALEGEEQGDFLVASTDELRPSPRVRGGAVSDAFEAVCARALSRAAAERYRDAGELLRALNAASSSGPLVQAPGATAAPPPEPTSVPPVAAVHPTTSQRPWRAGSSPTPSTWRGAPAPAFAPTRNEPAGTFAPAQRPAAMPANLAPVPTKTFVPEARLSEPAVATRSRALPVVLGVGVSGAVLVVAMILIASQSGGKTRQAEQAAADQSARVAQEAAAACVEARAKGTLSAWTSYLDQHPIGSCATEATRAAATLRREQEDEQACASARSSSGGEWTNYLSQHADGGCSAEARREIRKALWTSASFPCRSGSTSAVRSCRMQKTAANKFAVDIPLDVNCGEVVFDDDGDPSELRGCSGGNLVVPAKIALKKTSSGSGPATWAGGFGGWYWGQDHEPYCCPGVWLVEPKDIAVPR